MAAPVLPTDSEERKNIPLFSGFLNYFPLACAAVARVSKRGNDKHNPGQPLHHARGKSNDHADCIARHLIDIETIDSKTGEYEDLAALAWRALALLQEREEKRLGKPMSRGSKRAAFEVTFEINGVPTPVEPVAIVDRRRWGVWYVSDASPGWCFGVSPEPGLTNHDGGPYFGPKAAAEALMKRMQLMNPNAEYEVREYPSPVAHTASDFKPGPV